MLEVSSAEVSKSFGVYREKAEGSRGAAPEPVRVLHYNKPAVVIVQADEYERLKRRDKMSLAIEELPEDLIDQIASSTMDPRFDFLNAK
ncbi:type II toxin-antitoxin system Phd/YefM family antitoxin [Roseicella frigidaeris]|uniref:Antitoxin n=1 Tax=Roseicella frigidaeris TaxID=2230885 RepID=A0A327LX48_9PROT|nr:type II toxin-antitoxin system Phd/YefM family antitoxin [Roseicella frigidaeris]RAI54713.1 hypothetical protein DOO78_25340 [Roseicella frigidaeris]